MSKGASERRSAKAAESTVAEEQIFEDFEIEDDLEDLLDEQEKNVETATEQPVKRRRGRPRKAKTEGNSGTTAKKRERRPAEIRVATVTTTEDDDGNTVNSFELLDHPALTSIGAGEKWLRNNAPGDAEVVVLRVARRFAPRVLLTRVE